MDNVAYDALRQVTTDHERSQMCRLARLIGNSLASYIYNHDDLEWALPSPMMNTVIVHHHDLGDFEIIVRKKH